MKFEDVDAVIAGIPFMKSKQGERIFDFVVGNRLRKVLELGFAHGKSTCYLAAAVDELGGGGHVLTIDRLSARDRSPNIDQLLSKCDLTERVTPIYAETSFAWELMKLLEQQPQPQFDFVYLDAGHTWDVTGYGFFLIDRLLRPGGWLLFDDLDWTIGGSPALQDSTWANQLPAEQRDTPQVRKVFELLVTTHPGYTEVYEQEGWGWARKRRSFRPWRRS